MIQRSEAELIRLLRYAAVNKQRGWALRGNFSYPLFTAGLIHCWHIGWGAYDFEFTKEGHKLLADIQPPEEMR